MTGSGPAGEVTFVDIRKRLAALTDALAGRLDAHRADAEKAAAERAAGDGQTQPGAGR